MVIIGSQTQAAPRGVRLARPASAPALRTAGGPGFSMGARQSRPRTPRRFPEPMQEWSYGWSLPQGYGPEPRYSIPSAGKGRGQSPGFRETFMDKQIRASSYIPGPGAFNHFEDNLCPGEANSARKLSAASARRRRYRPQSAPYGARGAGGLGMDKDVPDPSSDVVDAKKIFLSRTASPRIPKEKRLASLSLGELRESNHSSLPMAYFTPGPGAYTQYAGFGMLPPRASLSKQCVQQRRAAAELSASRLHSSRRK
mmetsp:Transcript_39915/g.85505  ORF Transcript_39915/g.85505 Transcript_39915/m.85505 type:complete len:255 (-) Transcript_39915:420-1184(-)|eukprot:CAMPEP_0206427308 /NCGR_PEP_ID=MMETSP0324_2-20121206/4947_1 /ASSEMBLY_ACC=CAM_ASM_000836 /TAXON_ID=2866 /ORGANISM="Crypthecodinium cohnii, Strain Seligo" /LENGTH=254 /DNA_ID=CAMNT_0053892531 /DNA_START=203 /DNA_END=967 /DNA_ORIENTATION=-